ncbi:MAG: phage tail spike protein [Acetanaerobacterium sp.]
MNYISIYDRLTRERLCFLENAYGLGYETPLNALWTARFSLPSDDPKAVFCQPYNFVEVFDGDRRVELFRILPSTLIKKADTKAITYQCEQVLATLIDDVLFGSHAVGNVGTYTPESIRYVLDRQTTPRWQLQQCDYQRQFLYTWENENLLSALFSVANPFTNDFMWVTDTTNMDTWYLSLIRRETAEQDGEIRYGKNMAGITREIDPTDLCTRLYLLGYGEGENQLNVKKANGGLPYIDADTQSKWGVISKIAVDTRFQSADSLLAYGRELLEASKSPYVSYKVESAANEDGTIKFGGNIRVLDDDLNISQIMPVVRMKIDDVTGDRTMSYTVANKAQDIASSMANLSDRQRITELYSQGSVNIDSANFADNADPTNPANLRFFIPDNVVRINEVNLTFSLQAFRAYSKSAAAGGGSSQTSSSGGGSSQTTSSGGGSSQTSSNGGGGTITSSSSTSYDNYTLYGTTIYGDDYSAIYTETVDGHRHGIRDHRHAVSLQPHSHNVSIPPHTHKVNIPSHRHDVDIPSHRHSISIPSHTHEIEYGIYEGSTASSATVRVDGEAIPVSMKPNQNYKITNYLAVDDDGHIQRGAWHTIEITPNSLTRVEASVQNTVFINPKGVQDL